MKFSKLFRKAKITIIINSRMDMIFIGFIIIVVVAGNFRLNSIPNIRGIPKRISTVKNIYTGLISKCLTRLLLSASEILFR